MRPFVIDTDPGTDDAIALVMALTRPDIHVEALTIVAGNVGLDSTVQNALYIAREVCGSDVPVYAGAFAPLRAKLRTAPDVHGHDGLGDIGLPLTGRQSAPGHAASALIAAANKYPGELIIVALAPLTNIARAIMADPSFAGKVKRCVVMGGAPDGVGNTSMSAEFNFMVDPDAAQMVLDSEMNVEIVGWDVTLKHSMLTPEDLAALRVHGKKGEFIVDIQGNLMKRGMAWYGKAQVSMPDPLAMAVAFEPDIAKTERVHMAVERVGEVTLGMSVVDRRFNPHPANVTLVTHVDRDRFIAMIHESVR